MKSLRHRFEGGNIISFDRRRRISKDLVTLKSFRAEDKGKPGFPNEKHGMHVSLALDYVLYSC